MQRLTDPDLLEAGILTSLGAAHRDLVQSLAFSPEANLLASGGYRTVKLWRRPDSVPQIALWGARDAVRSLAVSGDGRWVAGGDAGGEITLWDLPLGQMARTFRAHSGPVTQILFAPKGTCFLSASLDSTIRVWDTSSGDLLAQVETPSPINALTMTGDGTQVASGGADGKVRVWPISCDPAPVRSPDPVREIQAHASAVTSLAPVGSDGKQVLSGGEDGAIRHWDWDTAKQIQQMNHGARVTAVAISPDGQRFASAGSDNLVKLWSPDDGQPISELKGDTRVAKRLLRLDHALAITRKTIEIKNQLLAEAKEAWEKKVQASRRFASASAKAEQAFARKTRATEAAARKKEAAERQAATLLKLTEEKKTAPGRPTAEAGLGEEAVQTRSAAQEAKERAGRLAGLAEQAAQEASEARRSMVAAKEESESTFRRAKAATADLIQTEAALAAAEIILEETKAELETTQRTAIAAEKPIRALAFSPDSRQLAIGGGRPSDPHLGLGYRPGLRDPRRHWSSRRGSDFYPSRQPAFGIGQPSDGTLILIRPGFCRTPSAASRMGPS